MECWLHITLTNRQLSPPGTQCWRNFSGSNAVNLDSGHYFAGTGLSPVPVIEKLHDRIASIHLKDRTQSTPGGRGANPPWGRGTDSYR